MAVASENIDMVVASGFMSGQLISRCCCLLPLLLLLLLLLLMIIDLLLAANSLSTS